MKNKANIDNRNFPTMNAKIESQNILVLAGFDPSGKAGILKDAEVIRHLGGHAMAVPTALTAQNFSQNYGFIPIDYDFFEKMLITLLSDKIPDAVKIGMVPDVKIASIIAKNLDRNLPIIYDPVLSSSDGKTLMKPGEEMEIFKIIATISTVVTPNIPEAEFFTKFSNDCDNFEERCAEKIFAMGADAVVIKGGHRDGENIHDTLFTADGYSQKYRRKRLHKKFRGTGCSFSSAMAKFFADRFAIQNAFLSAERAMDEMLASFDSIP